MAYSTRKYEKSGVSEVYRLVNQLKRDGDKVNFKGKYVIVRKKKMQADWNRIN